MTNLFWGMKMLIAFVFVFSSQVLAATSIQGTVTFLAKPPLVGIVYLPTKEQLKNSPSVDQIGKQFTEKMLVIPSNSSIKFKNSDDVDHNVFANDRKQNAKFDIGLMSPGDERNIMIDWKENSIVRVGCKIHPKMRTYLATLNTPYFRVLEFDKNRQKYRFEIENIPDGATTVILNIPKYTLVKIDISQGKSWEVPILKKGNVRGSIEVKKVS